jgi:hypothetical protein
MSAWVMYTRNWAGMMKRIAVFEKGRELTRDERTFQAHIARVYALMGKRREARQMISRRLKRSLFMLRVFTQRSATRMRHSGSWRKRLRKRKLAPCRTQGRSAL